MIDVALERTDLRLWVASAAVILALHASAGLWLMSWHDVLAGDEGTEAIVVDLAPFTGPAAEIKRDLAPGPEQQQAAPVPEPQPKEPDQKLDERIEPPPSLPNADVTLPREMPKEPERPKEEMLPPAPLTTAPPPPRPSAAQLSSWHRKIVIHLERHKNYPRRSSGAPRNRCRDGRVHDRPRGQGCCHSCHQQLRLCLPRSGNHRHGSSGGAVPAASCKSARANIRFHSAHTVPIGSIISGPPMRTR